MDELIVGTYEGFLLGYSLTYIDEGKKLKQTFATNSHTASIRCVSLAGKFMASGGTDDKVVVIDMKSRKEHTVLMNHNGTVNTVAFTNGGTHLLTGSDDGCLIITRVGNWKIEKIWKKAHGGQPVTAIAVHPSDKLALSIGGDKTLRTWNLIKGRPAFTVNLASKGVSLPTDIKFAPGGDRFSLVSLQNVDVWTISKAGVEKRLTCTSKPSCVQWVSDDSLLVGMENGNIVMMNVKDTQAQTYCAHKERVKCLHFENSLLYSASSSGELKVWSVGDTKNKLKETCSINTGCRVTCITLNRQTEVIKKEEEASDDEADSDKEEKANNEDSNDELVETTETRAVKRKPGAFVTISYGDEQKDNDTNPPPNKKTKRKKRNKKQKKNQ